MDIGEDNYKIGKRGHKKFSKGSEMKNEKKEMELKRKKRLESKFLNDH
jgi:hypothetical protein